jgi:hypothetical protein
MADLDWANSRGDANEKVHVSYRYRCLRCDSDTIPDGSTVE